MVESVKELKKICSKKSEPVVHPSIFLKKPLFYIYRGGSFYFTKILLYFPINANQVSILGVEIGLIASIFFIFDNPLYFSLGGVLLFFHAMADYCDGEVARYYNRSMVRGKEKNLGGFFDWSNAIPNPIVILCLTVGFLASYKHLTILFFGLYTSVFWILNHWFYSWRNPLFEINNTEGYMEDRINVKISNTFDGKISRLLRKAMFSVRNILKKFEISRADFKKGYYYSARRDKSLYEIRGALRFTQHALLFPFIFIFTGVLDFLISDFKYFTFSVWVYFGISGTVLFILEEYLIRKGELRNANKEKSG